MSHARERGKTPVKSLGAGAKATSEGSKTRDYTCVACVEEYRSMERIACMNMVGTSDKTRERYMRLVT